MNSQNVAVEAWTQQVKEIHTCRICGNPELEPVIDLGRQAIASLFDDGRSGPLWDSPIPLQVVRCQSRSGHDACGFVQLRHTVPVSILYRDYGYRSGINTTMQRHLGGLVQEIEATVSLREGDVVLDIGANDGTTLLAYRQPGLVKVAFEPSNIRPEADDHGLLYVPTVFSRREFDQRLAGRRAKVVTSIAMFYDVEDPRTFCRDIYSILEDDGVWVLEMSYLGTMLRHTAFDAICHEHLGYYSLQVLRRLVQEAGFMFQDITFNEANGGSVRCTMVKQGRQQSAAPRAWVARALDEERRLGYDTAAPYEAFRVAVHGVREQLRALLDQRRRQGQRIYGYGASTKGNVLLQYCGIGPQDVIAIADRNPAKVGRRTLGSRIPICSEDEMRAAHPDILLILPWHFLQEFLERERRLREVGTRFIVPLPQVRVV